MPAAERPDERERDEARQAARRSADHEDRLRPDEPGDGRWVWALVAGLAAALLLAAAGGAALVIRAQRQAEQARVAARVAEAEVARAADDDRRLEEARAGRRPADPASVSPPPAPTVQTPTPPTGPVKPATQPDPPPSWEQVLQAAGVIADRMAADEPAATERRLQAVPNSEAKNRFNLIRGLLDHPSGTGWMDPETVAVPQSLGLKEYVTARRVAVGRKSAFGPALEARFRARATVREPVLKRESLDVYTGWHLAGQVGPVTDRHVTRLLVDHYAGRKPFVLDDYLAAFTAFTRDDPPGLKPVALDLPDEDRPAAKPPRPQPVPKRKELEQPNLPPVGPVPAPPPPKPRPEPKREEEERPVPGTAITLPKRALYVLAETAGDLTAYRDAEPGSDKRTELERLGKVVRYTDPPVVTVVRKDKHEAVVDVWSGPLKGKQRVIQADYLADR